MSYFFEKSKYTESCISIHGLVPPRTNEREHITPRLAVSWYAGLCDWLPPTSHFLDPRTLIALDGYRAETPLNVLDGVPQEPS